MMPCFGGDEHGDVEKGRRTIDSWDGFKRDLKSQFLPKNVEFHARKKLRKLKHIGDFLAKFGVDREHKRVFFC